MKRTGLALAVSFALIPAAWAPAAGQGGVPDTEGEDRIGLADLAAYRAALSGRPIADEARPSDPPARVGFRDLWGRTEAYRGRRVTVVGRLERTFRQGAVGSFPPLAESWIFSPSGDPFCIVYPGPESTSPDVTERASPPAPAGRRGQEARGGGARALRPGGAVRFTGTFLKTVRYSAGDGQRLAPLIVGERPPEPEAPAQQSPATGGAGAVLRAVGGGGAPSRSGDAGDLPLAIGLAAIAALVIAWQHLRGAGLRRAERRPPPRDSGLHDPPLHFLDPPGNASSLN